MSIEEGAKLTFHVGRLNAKGHASFAFDLARREDGGIRITNIKQSLTSQEREAIFAHFGSGLRARTGGIEGTLAWENVEHRDPGTPEHFLAAVHALPDPFCLVSSPEE